MTNRIRYPWPNRLGLTKGPTMECLDGPQGCEGAVELRLPLTDTGRSFPRCEKHWGERLDRQREIDERYPAHPPADWSPLDAGESWYEDE